MFWTKLLRKYRAIDANSSQSGQFAATDVTRLTRGSPPDIGAYEEQDYWREEHTQ